MSQRLGQASTLVPADRRPHSVPGNPARLRGRMDFLAGGGQMGELVRKFDWSKTPLGSAETWSPALRMMVRFLLANRFPLLLWWGPQYVSIYNDAYRPILGTKHPWALGQPVSECWKEIWHILQPLIDRPFHGGPATWNDDIFLEINRHGFVEETHFTIAYSPVPDESVPSGIGGVLATVHEITAKVIGERRVAALRDLSAQAAEAKTAEEACRIAAKTLASHDKDIPFALLYLFDADGKRARLAGSAGIVKDGQAFASFVDLGVGEKQPWPLAEVMRTDKMQVVEDLVGRFGGGVPQGPWSDPPREAVVVPIRSNIAHQLAGVLVAGISVRLKFDDLYRSFYELLAGQIATAVANSRAYEEERKRAEALADLDRAKTMFFSNVSHEFRTPLTLMLGPLEDTLAQSDGLADESRERLQVAHRNSLRLLKLVNTLLDFSRIEAGRIDASYEPTDLATYTAELASVFRSAMEKAGLRYVVDCPSLPEPVHVDRDMWEKIVFNLLSNALKFTFQGEISVTLRCSSERVELVVADTGEGIPANELPRIFERFHRVRATRSRSYEGTGIGLALVRELVRLHGGEVRVESAEGRGATFRVSIPTGIAHLPKERINAARRLNRTAVGASPFVEEALRWLPDAGRAFDSLDVSANLHAQTSSLTQSKLTGASNGNREHPRILLADDNSDMRDYLCRLLAGHGFDITAVGDGQAALDSAQLEPPALIVSDVMMPRLDGFALLRALRSDPATKTIPFILLSARAGEEARVEGLHAGADDYIIKPFNARELVARITTQIELARVRHQAAQVETELRAQARTAKEQLLELLSETLAQLLSARDPDTIVRELFPKVAAHLGVDTYFNFMLNDTGDGLNLHSCAGIPDDTARAISRLEIGQAICGTVAQTRQPIHATDIQNSSYEKAELVRGFGIQCYNCNPLLVGDRLLGTLSFASRTRKAFDEDELQFLRIISQYTAIALERLQTAQQLEKTVENRTASLREAVEQMEEFSYSVSHDLRAPLRAMSAYVGVLLEDYGASLDDTARGYLEKIRRGSDRMDRLTMDVLAYSRLARSQLQPEAIDLERLVSDVIHQYTNLQPPAAEIEIKGPLLNVLGHETTLGQVVSNLLSNAVKFVAPGVKPRVRIWTEGLGKNVRVWFEDNGIAIKPEHRERIFQMFERVHPDGKYEGTGIGLTIARKAVEKMGGKIGVESDGQSGSRFWIELRSAE